MAMNRVLCLIIIQWLTLSPLYAFLYNGLDSRLVDKRSTKCQSCGRFAGAKLLICLKSNRCDTYVGKRTSKSFFGNGNQENYILQLLQEDDNAGLIHRDEENPWYF
ncbi:hypothetical protein HOLleu_33538 [Holothuria leucospilota]|uniref:Uncharacterized protein n=1 Tax=Holothuria leucospilota TaxID=206669 RepID=A0A9Q1BHT9_HOLLE|nr:hypothetical protein HOLleu_33538 [Holothuria leucospilota]